jgi:hypothetical protein
MQTTTRQEAYKTRQKRFWTVAHKLFMQDKYNEKNKATTRHAQSSARITTRRPSNAEEVPKTRSASTAE